MKQFVLFAGDCYYPGGGVSDFIGDFHNLIDAQIFPLRSVDWAHILNTETGEVIEFDDHKGQWVTMAIKEWQR